MSTSYIGVIGVSWMINIKTQKNDINSKDWKVIAALTHFIVLQIR